MFRVCDLHTFFSCPPGKLHIILLPNWAGYRWLREEGTISVVHNTGWNSTFLWLILVHHIFIFWVIYEQNNIIIRYTSKVKSQSLYIVDCISEDATKPLECVNEGSSQSHFERVHQPTSEFFLSMEVSECEVQCTQGKLKIWETQFVPKKICGKILL